MSELTPAEIGKVMTEAFGEERGREIVEAIVALAVDITIEEHGDRVANFLFHLAGGK